LNSNTGTPLILIVDDDAIILQILKTTLQEKGFRTLVSENGGQAIEAARDRLPDLILLDIMMPDLSGYEVSKKLREFPETSHIPIIFITGKTDMQSIVKGFQAGAVDYVTKPFSTQELVARVTTQVELKRAEKERMEKERLKGILEMAGAICHEMNQPLQAASGLAELLLMDWPADDERCEDIREIKEHIKRMGTITKKLMKITKYETMPYLKGSKIIDIDKASSSDA